MIEMTKILYVSLFYSLETYETHKKVITLLTLAFVPIDEDNIVPFHHHQRCSNY